MAGLSCRRRCSVGRREPRGLLRYSDEEWARIVQVAAGVGMRPGAWAQLAAHDAAVRELHGRTGDRAAVDGLVEELRQHRRVLTNIGGNLNQLARVANATGVIESPVAVATVVRLVRNVVYATEEVIERVRAEVVP